MHVRQHKNLTDKQVKYIKKRLEYAAVEMCRGELVSSFYKSWNEGASPLNHFEGLRQMVRGHGVHI